MRIPFFAALVLLSACVPPAPEPEPEIEISHDALVGRCFQLLDSAGDAIASRGGMWSGVIKLDTARASRMGRMRYLDGVYRNGWYDVTSLAPASAALDEDTLRFSSHWSTEQSRLLLSRTTGFTGETISLTPAGRMLLGERMFFSDVVVPGAQPRVQRVRLLPRPCPDQAAGRS